MVRTNILYLGPHLGSWRMPGIAVATWLFLLGFSTDAARSDDPGGLLALINQHRASHALGELISNNQLDNAASGHARYLVKIGRLDHKGPGSETLADRLVRAGYDYRHAGENLASGTASSSTVLHLWLDSEGHRRTLMEPAYNQAGLSRMGKGNSTYWVLVLGVQQP